MTTPNGCYMPVQQLLALHQATLAITSELDLDSLLQQIVDSARDLIGCRYAALGVLGDDGFIVRFPTSGLSATEREQLGAPPRGHGLLGVMLRAGRSLRIPAIQHDSRRSGFPPHHPPMTSLLGVPIWVQGRLMGDLYLTDKIDGPAFSEEDEWLVQLLATHAATALTNAALHDQVRREQARAQALLEVTQAINSSVELDAVMQLILHSATQLLGAAGAAVYLLDESATAMPRQETPVVRYAVGLSGLAGDHGLPAPPAYSIAKWAVATGQPQLIPDVAADPTLLLPRLTDERTVRSVVAVPLWRGHAVLGALSLYFDRLGAVDPAAVQLLTAIGTQATVAIGNAQLYEAARQGRAAAEREGQRLRDLEQMKDTFLSTAAHELRTPLTTIRLSAGLACEQLEALLAATAAGEPAPFDRRVVDLVRLLEESSQRMQALVNDLLDLTRLEQGRTPLVRAAVDLREVVAEAVAATRPLFSAKEQVIILHLPEAQYGVWGDQRRLEQVLINLLSNAHKYAPAHSAVEIRGYRTGDECRVAVRDAGPGVPDDEQARIFEPFYRSTLHQQDRTAGTGLGLPIARTIAELHGGHLWVEPAPGGGSLFILALPLAT
ncbi:MAG: GAF domain-containing protein [Chloroflexota bacterium]|nr:GAF domain-containing protein [Chloroflexota bacterium]